MSPSKFPEFLSKTGQSMEADPFNNNKTSKDTFLYLLLNKVDKITTRIGTICILEPELEIFKIDTLFLKDLTLLIETF